MSIPIHSENTYGRFFVVPQDEKDNKFLESVDNKTRRDVDLKYGIMFDYLWHANTVTLGVIESIITDLAFRLRSGSSTPRSARRSKPGCGINDMSNR